jgi:hypothetical protein
VIEVLATTPSGFSILQNSGQSIEYGIALTTVGVAGSLSSTRQGDSLRLICINPDTAWQVTSSVGNLEIV